MDLQIGARCLRNLRGDSLVWECIVCEKYLCRSDVPSCGADCGTSADTYGQFQAISGSGHVLVHLRWGAVPSEFEGKGNMVSE